VELRNKEGLYNMISQMLRPFYLYIGAFVAMAILTSSSALSQSPSAPVTLLYCWHFERSFCVAG
jgi:hypothetical protein